MDGLIITEEALLNTTDDDVLKIVVVNRYFDAEPAVAYVKGFGLKKGAIASSVAHDSHNIVAVGVSDEDIVEAVNSLIAVKGGLAVSADDKTSVLPLPVAGIMSNADAFEVVTQYSKLDELAKKYGSPFRAPFMTLSFMALLVIPKLKLSDLGLFDGSLFEFVEVAV
jgi:adenine deaminase